MKLNYCEQLALKNPVEFIEQEDSDFDTNEIAEPSHQLPKIAADIKS